MDRTPLPDQDRWQPNSWSTRANDLYQLLVTASRHLYLTADGTLRWQKEVLETSLTRPRARNKPVILHFVMRDHFSGAAYGEFAPTKEAPSVKSFLVRAWECKPDLPLHRLPNGTTIPTIVADVCPAFGDFLRATAVDAYVPRSGIASGVRDIQTCRTRSLPTSPEGANPYVFHE